MTTRCVDDRAWAIAIQSGILPSTRAVAAQFAANFFTRCRITE